MNKKHDFLYNLEHSIPQIDNFKKEMYDDTIYYQEKLGFEKSSDPAHSTWNNEADAFKHAFMQAYSEYKQIPLSGILADLHERNGNKYEGQPRGEENMDKWNNNLGRQIGKDLRNELKETKQFFTEKQIKDFIAVKILEKMRNGELITNPNDARKYEDLIKGNPTGGASKIEERPFTRQEIAKMTTDEFKANESLIMKQLEKGVILDESLDYEKQFPQGCLYTREDIARMSSKEYEKQEKDILKQMKKQGIPSEKDLPKGEKSGYSKSSADDGCWVTINGNHVLIKD